MVCIPCILIPAFLWIYHKFIRPYMGPVFVKLEEWMAPLKAKWCPECTNGICPVKPSKSKNSGSIQSEKVGTVPDTVNDGEELSIGESLSSVIRKGDFGADISGLRSRVEQRIEEAQR